MGFTVMPGGPHLSKKKERGKKSWLDLIPPREALTNRMSASIYGGAFE
jgi:hypothetical protein